MSIDSDILTSSSEIDSDGGGPPAKIARTISISSSSKSGSSNEETGLATAFRPLWSRMPRDEKALAPSAA